MQPTLLALQNDNATINLQLDDEVCVQTYIAVSAPDIEAVSDIVPAERFENAGDVHVFAIDALRDIDAVLDDALSSVANDDTVVMLCSSAAISHATICTLFNVDAIEHLIN